MFAPLYKLGVIGEPGLIIIALLVGFVFGFILESTGFGNGTKIAAIFYGTDWRVFKMMFSVVLTAMVLTFTTYYLGWLDLNLVQLAMAYVWPVAVGGMLLGAGMVIGGYCPGTSMVSIATRKVDGIIFSIGFMVGVVIYAEIYTFVRDFSYSSNLGKVTLSDVTGIPYGILVFIVVLIGIGSFILVDKLQGKIYPSVNTGDRD